MTAVPIASRCSRQSRLSRPTRTAGRTTPGASAGVRDGERAAPAVTSLDTSSLRGVRTSRHSSAVAAPLRRSRRRRFPLRSSSDSRLSGRPSASRLHTPRIPDAEGAWARRAFLFNDLGGLGAPFGVPFLFDGVASPENRAGSRENRDQAAGIADVFYSRFFGEPPRPTEGSRENRGIRPEILERTVQIARKFSREPSRFSPLPPPYRTLSSAAGTPVRPQAATPPGPVPRRRAWSAPPRPECRMFVCR